VNKSHDHARSENAKRVEIEPLAKGSYPCQEPPFSPSDAVDDAELKRRLLGINRAAKARLQLLLTEGRTEHVGDVLAAVWLAGSALAKENRRDRRRRISESASRDTLEHLWRVWRAQDDQEDALAAHVRAFLEEGTSGFKDLEDLRWLRYL